MKVNVKVVRILAISANLSNVAGIYHLQIALSVIGWHRVKT